MAAVGLLALGRGARRRVRGATPATPSRASFEPPAVAVRRPGHGARRRRSTTRVVDPARSASTQRPRAAHAARTAGRRERRRGHLAVVSMSIPPSAGRGLRAAAGARRCIRLPVCRASTSPASTAARGAATATWPALSAQPRHRRPTSRAPHRRFARDTVAAAADVPRRAEHGSRSSSTSSRCCSRRRGSALACAAGARRSCRRRRATADG